MSSYAADALNAVYDLCHDGKTGRCYYCGKAISFKNYGRVGEKGAWEVDHFIPESRGGIHSFENWVPACVPCNTEKGDMMPWEYQPGRFPGDWPWPGPCL